MSLVIRPVVSAFKSGGSQGVLTTGRRLSTVVMQSQGGGGSLWTGEASQSLLARLGIGVGRPYSTQTVASVSRVVLSDTNSSPQTTFTPPGLFGAGNMGAFHLRFLIQATQRVDPSFRIPVADVQFSSAMRDLEEQGVVTLIEHQGREQQDFSRTCQLMRDAGAQGAFFVLPDVLLPPAASAGIPLFNRVLIEKPVGTPRQILDLMILADAHPDTDVRVGYQRGFFPQVAMMAEMIQSEVVAGNQVTLVSVHSRDLHTIPGADWLRHHFNQGGHDLNLLKVLTGSRVSSISSVGVPYQDLEHHDTRMASMQGTLDNGAVFMISIARDNQGSGDVTYPDEFPRDPGNVTTIQVEFASPISSGPFAGLTSLHMRAPGQPSRDTTFLEQYLPAYDRQAQGFVYGLPVGATLQDAFDVSQAATLAVRSVDGQNQSFVIRRVGPNRITFGVAGCSAGIVGDALRGPFGESSGDRFVVAGATSRRPESTDEFAGGLPEHPVGAFEDVAGLVAHLTKQPNPVLYVPLVPSESKMDLVLDAVGAGVTVLVEKPFMTNAREISVFMAKYYALKASSDTPVGEVLVGQHSLTHPAFELVQSIVAEQDGITSFDFSFGWPKTEGSDSRMFDRDGGGPVLDLGVYGVSLVNALNDGASLVPDGVTLKAFTVTEDKALETDVDARLEYDNGTTARIHVSMKPEVDGKSWFKVHFKNGNTLVVKDVVHPHRCTDPGKFAVLIGPDGQEIQSFELLSGDSSYLTQLTVVGDVAEGKRPVPWHMTVEAAHRNAQDMDAILARLGITKQMAK